MAVNLSRVYQIGVAVETTEGVAATSAAPTDSDPSFLVDTSVASPYQRRVFDPNVRMVPFEADVTRDKPTLTPDVTVKGPGKATFGWTEDMAGGSVSLLGSWGPGLQACGFGVTVGTGVRKITIAAPSAGSFAAGQIIGNNATQGSATATGFVVAFSTVGSTRTLWYKVLTGIFADTDTLYNYGQGTQGQADILTSPANGGHRFFLQTETASVTPKSATVEYRDDEMVLRGIGCRGNARFNLSFGNVPTVEFTFEGPAQFRNEAKQPLLANFVAGVASLPQPTLVVGDVTGSGAGGIPFLIDGYSGWVMTQMTIDLGNTVTERRTIAEGGVVAYLTQGTKCGYAPTRITARQPRATIDPEYPANASYSLTEKLAKGSTHEALMQVGALRASGNQAVVFYAKRGQWAGEFSTGDRDGIKTFDGQIRLCGDVDDELEIFHIFA